MLEPIPVFTLDGPAGAGKGTVSRAIAQRLGWHYLDSGAIYRALSVAVEDAGVTIDDLDGLVKLALAMDLSFASGDAPCVLLSGRDITDRIATEACGNITSQIAALGPVRQALLQKQREFRRLPGLVADGRDMGTVVFTDAEFKVFLTATAEERAKRRYKQLKQKGIDVNLMSLAKEIEERDRRDRERSVAPLKMAEDAVLVDTSDLSIEAVVARCLALVNA